MTFAIHSLNKLLSNGDGQGRVWLVGAGPGDVELLTVKALRLLHQAEVVVYDRLVSEAVMAEVPTSALCIDVGKQPGRHGMKQGEINQLLADLARGGREVVRLKGGDPFIFGRGGEELAFLQQAQVRCEVVPGITAAVGCAAASNIPLTHRDCAQSLRLITGHGKLGEPQLADRAYGDPRETLVFYMGLSQAPHIQQQLMRHGMRGDMPAALIENGTSTRQRVVTGTLDRLSELAQQVESPSLIIIGSVVSLRDRLRWF